MMEKLIAAALVATPLLFAPPAQAEPCDATCTYNQQMQSLTNAFNVSVANLTQQRGAGQISSAEFKSGLNSAQATYKAGRQAANAQLKAALTAKPPNAASSIPSGTGTDTNATSPDGKKRK